MVDMEGTEVIGPLLVASVAIGALGTGSFLDLLVPGKTRRKQKKKWGRGVPEKPSLTLILGSNASDVC